MLISILITFMIEKKGVVKKESKRNIWTVGLEGVVPGFAAPMMVDWWGYLTVTTWGPI